MAQSTASSDQNERLTALLGWLRENIGIVILGGIGLMLMAGLLVQAFSDPREMQKFIRLTYSGFTDGMLLALIALGLVLIFKATDVINFAHGEFMLLGGFIGYQVLTDLTTDSNAVLSDLGIGTVYIVAAIVAFYFIRQPVTHFVSNQESKPTRWGLTALVTLGLLSVALVPMWFSQNFMFGAISTMILGVAFVTHFERLPRPLMVVIAVAGGLGVLIALQSFILAAVAAMLVAAVLIGILLERVVLRPLIGEPIISVIMVTIGLSSIIHAIVGIIWGNNPVPLPLEVIPDNILSESGRFEIAFEGTRRPLFLSHENLILIAIVMAVTGLLLLFFRYSKYGIAMRATADDQQAAMSMGISIKVMFAFAWSMAAISAALAGLMIGETSVGISGQEIPVIGLRAFPVIILGGLDSIWGAIIGGLLIGLIETYTGGYIDPSLKEVMPYLVLLVVLMVRPYGLFGQEIIERV